MSSLRSSVRPKSSKQAWGTILHPEFGMGYQKMTSYEVEQTVSRLYISPDRPERYYERVQQAELSGEGIKGMVGSQTWLMHTSILGEVGAYVMKILTFSKSVSKSVPQSYDMLVKFQTLGPAFYGQTSPSPPWGQHYVFKRPA